LFLEARSTSADSLRGHLLRNSCLKGV